jgi:hypothetical protein
MNSFVKKGLYCALFVGGLSLLGIGTANAAETSGEDGLASGTQLVTALEAPVTLAGNAISVIGDSSSGSAAAASPTPLEDPATSPSATTSGSDAIASGTQAFVDPVLPITVSDNAISVIGNSDSSGSSGSSSAAPTTNGSASPATTAESSGADSILGGTQALVQPAIPVQVTGNAVSVVGDSNSSGPSSATPVRSGGASQAATTDVGDTGDIATGSTTRTGREGSAGSIRSVTTDAASVVPAPETADLSLAASLLATSVLASRVRALASTGPANGVLLALAALFPLAGFGLLLVARGRFDRLIRR